MYYVNNFNTGVVLTSRLPIFLSFQFVYLNPMLYVAFIVKPANLIFSMSHKYDLIISGKMF